MTSGFPLTSKQTFLRPQNRSKTPKIVGIIVVSSEDMHKILGQNVSRPIRLLFGL